MGADSSIQRIVRLTPLHAVLACIQSRVTPVAPRRSALAFAQGATLAEDVVSAERPQRAIALRDGFAVEAAAIADAGPYMPVPLTLIARRIDAGDALPSGTDAVAPLDAIALRGDRAEAVAAVAQQAEHQRELAIEHAQQQARQEDDILASVDRDISREVPSAMEPLAALTEDSAATGN